MFGALNRFISRLDSDSPTPESNARRTYGFQVLRNSNNELPIEPWFDFIIGINGRNIDSADPALFSAEVRNCAGNSVNLGLWSAKGQRLRSLYTQVPPDAGSLGLSLQWQPISTTEDVWHILDVAANSPADNAGLLPYGDYIIGSPEGLLKGEAGLGELVEDYLTRPMRLFVYNHEYDVTRLVTIQPSKTWGGAGALGCTLGYGALHRIPPPLHEPPQAPGEMMFEAARLSTDGEPGPPEPTSVPPTSNPAHYLVPAEMPIANAPPTGGPPTGGSKKARTQRHTAKTDMDSYFAEGEEKSRREDHAKSPNPNAPGVAPPPPKAGPPPKGDTTAKSEE